MYLTDFSLYRVLGVLKTRIVLHFGGRLEVRMDRNLHCAADRYIIFLHFFSPAWRRF